MKDYYAILNVANTASSSEIKDAWKRARLVHPDINSSPDATSQFQDASEAYEVLSDADKRRNYDLLHSSQPRKPQQNNKQTSKNTNPTFPDLESLLRTETGYSTEQANTWISSFIGMGHTHNEIRSIIYSSFTSSEISSANPTLALQYFAKISPEHYYLAKAQISRAFMDAFQSQSANPYSNTLGQTISLYNTLSNTLHLRNEESNQTLLSLTTNNLEYHLRFPLLLQPNYVSNLLDIVDFCDGTLSYTLGDSLICALEDRFNYRVSFSLDYEECVETLLTIGKVCKASGIDYTESVVRLGPHNAPSLAQKFYGPFVQQKAKQNLGHLILSLSSHDTVGAQLYSDIQSALAA